MLGEHEESLQITSRRRVIYKILKETPFEKGCQRDLGKGCADFSLSSHLLRWSQKIAIMVFFRVSDS